MARHARGSRTWIILLIIVAALGITIAAKGVITLLNSRGSVAPPKASVSAPHRPHQLPAPHRPSQRQHEPPERYIVQHGDSLWAIAVQHYHDGLKWHQLYRVNMKIIGNNPDRIFPGQTLTLTGGP